MFKTNFSIIDGVYLLGWRTDEKEKFRMSDYCSVIFENKRKR